MSKTVEIQIKNEFNAFRESVRKKAGKPASAMTEWIFAAGFKAGFKAGFAFMPELIALRRYRSFMISHSVARDSMALEKLSETDRAALQDNTDSKSIEIPIRVKDGRIIHNADSESQ